MLDSNPPSPLPACLQYLSEQTDCALGPVGVAARIPPDVEMMRQARLVAREHVPALQWMLAHACPGGQIYAAMLLGELGPEQGKAAWKQLTAVDAWVTVAPGGCEIMRAYVSDFAKSMLHTGQLFGYREEPGEALVRQPAPERLPPSMLGKIQNIVDGISDRIRERMSTPLAAVIGACVVGAVIGLGYLLQECVKP